MTLETSPIVEISKTNKKVNIVFDATMFDTFQLCAARFDYRFNKNKVLPVRFVGNTIEPQLEEPLDKGLIIHLGMEYYYNALKQKLSFSERIDAAINAMNVQHATNSEINDKLLDTLKIALVENLTYWRYRDEKLIVLDVENSFSYVLYEDETIRIIMIGKIDLLVDEEIYTNLPYDHKSYSYNSPLTRLTNQFTNYAYATQSNYLVVNRIGLQTSLKPEEKHKRIMLSYDPLFFEQWKKNVIDYAYQYLECVITDTWPMNLTSCDKYNRPCAYKGICESSGIEAKIWRLESNYNTIEPWDVSKSLGTDHEPK